MRLVVGILAFAGAIALADTPAPAPTQSATSPASLPAAMTSPAAVTSPATAASPATTTATPPVPVATPSHEIKAAIDPREKILRNKGYRLEVHNGEKVYCRNEEVLGSRLGGKKTCGTVEELEEREHLSRAMIEGAQRTQLNLTGK